MASASTTTTSLASGRLQQDQLSLGYVDVAAANSKRNENLTTTKMKISDYEHL